MPRPSRSSRGGFCQSSSPRSRLVRVLYCCSDKHRCPFAGLACLTGKKFTCAAALHRFVIIRVPSTQLEFMQFVDGAARFVPLNCFCSLQTLSSSFLSFCLSPHPFPVCQVCLLFVPIQNDTILAPNLIGACCLPTFGPSIWAN